MTEIFRGSVTESSTDINEKWGIVIDPPRLNAMSDYPHVKLYSQDATTPGQSVLLDLELG